MTTRRARWTPRQLSAPIRVECEALREMMLYCMDGFPTYTRIFDAKGISRNEIAAGDSLGILHQLPTLGPGDIHSLSSDVLNSVDSIVDTETSSGTSGSRKIRYITHDDNLNEHRFLAQLLSIAGVNQSDRVACVDTDPAAVMVSFPWACELLGAAESYCVSTGTDFGKTLPLLRRLQPSVLISVPSIIQRLLDEGPTIPLESIGRVIYIGEGMTEKTRVKIAEGLGAEVHSYYGTSETSAIGIECRAHDGVHLMTSRHLLELDTSGHQDNVGELIVTTLEQRGLPLLRYRVGDLVRLREGRCGCGLEDPRVDILGRSEPFASILGSKIHHGGLLNSLNAAGMEGPLQVVLTSEGRMEVMTLRLSDANSARVDSMRHSVLDDHTDIEFLCSSGFLEVRFEFHPLPDLLATRKSDVLTDLRQ